MLEDARRPSRSKLQVGPSGEVDDDRLDFIRLQIRRHSRRMLKEGYPQQFVLIREPEHVRPTHVHEYDAQVHVLKGELRIETAAVSDTIYEGQFRLIDAGTPHSESSGGEGAILLVGCR